MDTAYTPLPAAKIPSLDSSNEKPRSQSTIPWVVGLLIVLILLFTAGIFYLTRQTTLPSPTSITTLVPSPSPSPIPPTATPMPTIIQTDTTLQYKTYTNKEMGIRFTYPAKSRLATKEKNATGECGTKISTSTTRGKTIAIDNIVYISETDWKNSIADYIRQMSVDKNGPEYITSPITGSGADEAVRLEGRKTKPETEDMFLDVDLAYFKKGTHLFIVSSVFLITNPGTCLNPASLPESPYYHKWDPVKAFGFI